MREACCALIFQGTQVLGVSRGDDLTAFGMPGGKLEAGETPEQAMVRELREETGLIAVQWSHLYTGTSHDGFLVHTYYVSKFSGQMVESGEGVPMWLSVQELVDGPFGSYNLRVFQKILDAIA